MEQLPSGTVVSIEGITYLRADNTILLIDTSGSLQTISDTLRTYTAKKIPRVIYGEFRFYPLG